MPDELTRAERGWLKGSQGDVIDLNALGWMEHGWRLCRAFDLAQAVQSRPLLCPPTSTRYAMIPEGSVFTSDEDIDVDQCIVCGWWKSKHGPQ